MQESNLGDNHKGVEVLKKHEGGKTIGPVFIGVKVAKDYDVARDRSHGRMYVNIARKAQYMGQDRILAAQKDLETLEIDYQFGDLGKFADALESMVERLRSLPEQT